MAARCGVALRIAALVEPGELLARDLLSERQVATVAHHGLLALAAQGITHELPEFRIQRLARCAVEVDMDVAYQRIASILKARRARGDVGTAVTSGQGERLDARYAFRLRHHGPGYSVAVMRELIPEHALQAHALLGPVLVRDHLAAALDVLAVIGIPLVAVLHDFPLEEARRARRRMPVRLDRLVRPLSLPPKLPPRTNVFLRASAVGGRPLESAHAGAALGSEYPVQLLQRESG